jgi:D-glycero-D-manno-heptose 1,7-bisphosphate phosphatase
MNRAVFLDRDGVINELIHYPEQGIIDSPFTASQFKLIPGIGEVISKLHELGFKIIIISNQPGIAKGYFTQETFEEIREKMKDELAKQGAFVDKEYYCFHHPKARLAQLRIDCECRKPKTGLLLQAAKDMGINLSESWVVGDGLTDVTAGKNAGCRTILLGKMKCELCLLMDEEGARPDFIIPNLFEIAKLITNKQTES